jgi:hypothetical protein
MRTIPMPLLLGAFLTNARRREGCRIVPLRAAKTPS